MKISFIIPTYNRAHLVSQTIESILRQPYSQKEIIVVDDGSTDDLEDVINKQKCSYLKYIKCNQNKGQNFARNLGIESTSAEIVTILDSDDQDYGNDLDFIIDYFQKYQHVSVIFTPVMSKKKLKIISNIKQCYFKMGFLQMIDGTYSGEYQAFFRRDKLPKFFFREDLCIKRSCTLLTFLEYFDKEFFTILPTLTKLYNDEHKDRLGNKNSIQKDSNELAKCYSLLIEEFGIQILSLNIAFYNNLIIKFAYYSLLSKGRHKGIASLKLLKFNPSLLYSLPLILICIILGGKNTAKLRSLF